MTAEEKLANLLDLVRRVRVAQKKYFQTRDRIDLHTSKQLERTLDTQIEILEQRTLL